MSALKSAFPVSNSGAMYLHAQNVRQSWHAVLCMDIHATHTHKHTHTCARAQANARSHRHTRAYILDIALLILDPGPVLDDTLQTHTLVREHTHTHMHTHARTHSHSHTHMCAHMLIHKHTRTPARRHTHAYILEIALLTLDPGRVQRRVRHRHRHRHRHITTQTCKDIPDIALLTLHPRPVRNDKSKVTDLDAVLVREKEIVRFQIEMQEVCRMNAAQAR